MHPFIQNCFLTFAAVSTDAAKGYSKSVGGVRWRRMRGSLSMRAFLSHLDRTYKRQIGPRWGHRGAAMLGERLTFLSIQSPSDMGLSLEEARGKGLLYKHWR